MQPATAAVRVPILSGFDYVTVDAARRRVYAAHTGSRALLVVDADSGAVVGQVRVGSLHGVAVDPATGHVFTGDGTDRTISEVDPQSLTVVRTVDVAGEVDAIAYDPASKRLYADEDEGTHLFVIDAATMSSVGTVSLPGHKPEYLAVDPVTHAVYQNISDLAEVAIVDPTTLTVTSTFPTSGVTGGHPLQYDPATRHLLVGGTNGVFAAYDVHGTLVGHVGVQARIDQCSFDATSRDVACAGSGELTILHDEPHGAPTIVGRIPIPASAHTVGTDATTGRSWIVWSEPDGDYVRAYGSAPR